MSVIALVYAVSKNGVIGARGGLPWHIPSDLQHFKRVTLGKPIIMGRKTWESLPRKPLPGRANIVLTRKADLADEGALVVPSVAEALQRAERQDPEEVCVIGGAEVFNAFWPLAQRIYLTKVLADIDGDTFMPQISPEDWQEIEQSGVVQGEKDSHPFQTFLYERRPERR